MADVLNLEKTLIPLLPRTAAPPPAEFEVVSGKALTVFVNVTAVTSPGSITVKVEARDPVTGSFLTLLTSAVLNGAGLVGLFIGLGVSETSNVSISRPLSRRMRVIVTHSSADSVTYGIGASIT